MIIGWLNEKGGVGKTSLCYNTGWYIASMGSKVLFIDFDSQKANLSFFCGIADRERCKTMYDVFENKCTIKDAIIPITENLHIIPANSQLVSISEKHTVIDFKKLLGSVINSYDYIFIDVSPSPARCHILTMGVSNYVIFPMLPDIATLEANIGIAQTYLMIVDKVNPLLRVMGIAFNKYNGRTRLARITTAKAEQMAKQLNTTIFNTKVRTNSALAECVAKHVGVTEYQPKSNGAADIIALTSEILLRGR